MYLVRQVGNGEEMKKKAVALIAKVLFYGLFTFAVYGFFFMLPDLQVEPPVCNGIVPGVTTKEESIAILGKPAKIVRAPFGVMYQYITGY